LKLLKRGTQTQEQVRATQLREARLASAIDHPNVCSIYEVGEAEDEAYIVMQYIPGKSLDKVIAEGPASTQLVLSSGIQISDGLAAAQNKNLSDSQSESSCIESARESVYQRRKHDDVHIDSPGLHDSYRSSHRR